MHIRDKATTSVQGERFVGRQLRRVGLRHNRTIIKSLPHVGRNLTEFHPLFFLSKQLFLNP